MAVCPPQTCVVVSLPSLPGASGTASAFLPQSRFVREGGEAEAGKVISLDDRGSFFSLKIELKARQKDE